MTPAQLGSDRAETLPGALVAGFAASVAVWVGWFITHVPWLNVAPLVAALVIISLWVLVTVAVTRGAHPRQVLKIGLAAGLLTALLGLLILGSKITESGSQFKPQAGLIVLGFIATGSLIGVVSGAIRLALGTRHTTRPDWLSRFAWATAAAAAPLLFVGGLVTSTGSGMAVPDWPTTFSSNMFLYPLGNAPASVFLEHSHRLFGTLLGLASLVLMVWTLIAEDRRWVKHWAVAIFVFVVLQGILGGLRVRLGDADHSRDNKLLAMFHGVSAQLIFSALVALAVFLSPLYKTAAPDASLHNSRRLRGISGAALHTTFLQLILGAIYRHFRGSHALWTHAGFSILVVILTALSGFYAADLSEPPAEKARPVARILRIVGRWQVGVVALQFLLGWAAFGLGPARIETDSVLQAVVRTAHQANGALLLAVTTVAAVLARCLCPKRSIGE